jgi:WD40 repeat protein
MGVVYEAEQISLGRRVALKVLPHQATRDGRALERFRREARAAAKLHHTNIVPVFEVNQEGDTFYYAMQFIAGQSLDQVITEMRRLRAGSREDKERQRSEKSSIAPPSAAVAGGSPALSQAARGLLTGHFPPAQPAATHAVEPDGPRTEGYVPSGLQLGSSATCVPAGSSSSVVLPDRTDLSGVGSHHRHYFQGVARIGQQTAQALAYAHARGVIHRDVKPSNLLLDAAGVVWVTDFGLAKTDDEGLTHTGDIIGTLRYMAPERFRGVCDARADVYALGVTLYELPVLQPAFDSSDRLRLLQAVQTQEPLRPRALDPRIPRDLETIVLTAMAREPARRYRTADEMAADLGGFLSGEPIRARRVGELERAWMWARRHPAVGTLLAAVVLLLVGGTAVSLFFAFEARYQAKKARDTQAAAEGQETEARQAEAEANRRLAQEQINRGLALCEQGETARGLHWLLEALRTVPAEDAAFHRVVRANLAGWPETAPALRHVLSHSDRGGAAYSPDGKTLVTTSNDKAAHVWDAVTGAPLRTLSHPKNVWRASLSPDGKTILTVTARGAEAGDPSAGTYVWDAATGRPLGDLQIPGCVFVAEFTPDGRTIVTGTKLTDFKGEIRVWDARTRQPAGPPLPQGEEVHGLFFLPDGHTVLSSGDLGWGSHFQPIDLKTGQGVGKPRTTSHPSPGVLLPGGQTLLYGETAWGGAAALTLHWLDVLTGAERWASPPTRGAGNTTLDAVSPDGRTCWFGSKSGRVDWRDAATGRLLISFLAQGGNARPSASNGRLCLVASHQAVSWVWEMPRTLVPNVEPVLGSDAAAGERGSRPEFQKIAFSPDGTRALLGKWGVTDKLRGGTARLIDTATGLPAGPPLRHPWEMVRCVAFSPDGKVLATGYHPWGVAGAIQLWDARTSRPLRPPLPLTNYPAALAFSSDGKRLATEAALEKAVEIGADPPMVLRLAEVLARRGRWERSAALLGKLRPAPLGLVHLHAQALLQAGHAAGYRRLCAGLAAFAAAQGDLPPPAANAVAWTCALGPGAVEDYGPVVALAEKAVAAARGEAKPLMLNTLGAVLYRAGRYKDALARLNEAVAARGGKGVVQDFLFLALVQHRLGKADEAQKQLAQALAARPERGDDKFWENAEVDLLRREARTLVEGKKDSPAR